MTLTFRSMVWVAVLVMDVVQLGESSVSFQSSGQLGSIGKIIWLALNAKVTTAPKPKRRILTNKTYNANRT